MERALQVALQVAEECVSFLRPLDAQSGALFGCTHLPLRPDNISTTATKDDFSTLSHHIRADEISGYRQKKPNKTICKRVKNSS